MYRYQYSEAAVEHFASAHHGQAARKHRNMMMHMVPTCSPSSPTTSSAADSFDFDLGLLEYEVPSLELPIPSLQLDCQVPSPTSCLSPIENFALSPTMFSPDTAKSPTKGKEPGNGSKRPHLYAPIASPPSVPASPYSPPAPKRTRMTSTDSSVSIPSLQDSIAEFQQLQDQVKREQDRAAASPMQQPTTVSSPVSIPTTVSLQVKIEPLEYPPSVPGPSHEMQPPQPQHSVLKQLIEDTSFTQRYNLKPFDFGVASGFAASHVKEEAMSPPPMYGAAAEPSEVKIEPVLSLAVEEVKKEIKRTCTVLNISPDPSHWSKSDTLKWMRWTMEQYNVPQYNMSYWEMNGNSLLSLTDNDFRKQMPQGGDKLYAQLDIWRNSAPSMYDYPSYSYPQPVPTTTVAADMSVDLENIFDLISSAERPESAEPPTYTDLLPKQQQTEQIIRSPPPPYPEQPGPSGVEKIETTSEGSAQEEEEDEEELPTTPSPVPHHPGRSSSNIHLWQFVKELLLQPHLYSGCIHWIDRQRGIFKIVDSVKVATLWGQRKNRPAMNYDKLSRSLRQYYRKGIMKKTERSQRLVYQFCAPYHL